ncbi:unnamed protein product [Clonostachys rhizophaga]|uniref:Uncharacterized protein n=1 Tax=Clonostachys rhizophaga TaxID=160324 RepID=A0A9N9V5W4_9HYPO|nr:unnamed protein product [Clonostachys rhizophaga]
MSEASEIQRQQCLEHLKGILQQLQFAETAARSLLQGLQNGPVFSVPDTAEFDGSHLPPLGPGTSLAYVTRDNYEEFEKAYLRAAEESEAGEIYCIMATADNMQGLTTRVVDTSFIQKAEDSNLQMSAEDVTGAGDEEAGNEAPKNKREQVADWWW